jgi:hypothetical protein
MAKISAHETTPGQTFSNAVLISSTTSNPAAEPPALGAASFSLSMPFALSSKIEPSHPYIRCMVKSVLVSSIEAKFNEKYTKWT